MKMKANAIPNPPTENEILRNFYQFVAREIPQGIKGSEHSYPVKIGNNELQAVIFGQVDDERIGVGLFVRPGTYTPRETIAGTSGKYSRKSLEISRNGDVRDDPIGTLPDFDLTDNEPDFAGLSNEKIAAEVVRQILAFRRSALN